MKTIELTQNEHLKLLPTWNRLKGDVYTGLFTKETRTITNEGNKSLFIYARKKKRYGNRIHNIPLEFKNKGIEKITVKLKDPSDIEAEWVKSWTKAINYLSASGLWSSLRKQIGDGLNIGYQKITQAFLIENEIAHANDDGITVVQASLSYEERENLKLARIKEIDARIDISWHLWHMRHQAIIKKMYFGKYANEITLNRIAKALQNKEPFKSGRHNNGRYDASFEYNPDNNDKPKAWYSEDYKNCGNGHYYLALNETHALFSEDN